MKEIINIIHDSETELFFKKVGQWEKLCRNEIQCAVCKGTITMANFRGAFRKGDDLFFFCNRDACSSLRTTSFLGEGY